MFEPCVRCGEAPGVDLNGYCGHCHWLVRAEVDQGFCQLAAYLRGWAAFREWEALRPVRPPL